MLFQQSADIFLHPLLLTFLRPSLRPVLIVAVKQLLLCARHGGGHQADSTLTTAAVGPACP